MHIERHSFNHANARSRYDDVKRAIGASLSIFEQGLYFVLRDLLSETIINYCYSIALDTKPQTITENNHLLIETGLGLYKMATNVGEPITFTFLDKKYDWMPLEKDYMATYQGFITVFLSAICARNMDVVKELNAIDIAKLKKNSKIIGGEYRLHYAKFLQKLFQKGEPHLNYLLEVSDNLEENKMPDLVYDFALHIDGPQIDLFSSILTNDEKSFNQHLENALILHKKYYSQSDEYSVIAEGLVSIPLSALKILALNQGFKVNVTSDYLIE